MASISASFLNVDARSQVYHSLAEKEAPKVVSMRANALSWADFKCSKTWVEAVKSPLHPDGSPTLIYEKTSGRVFWNNRDCAVRWNSCVNLLSFIPIVLPFGLYYSAKKVAKLISCYHFWCCLNKTKEMMVFTLPPRTTFNLHHSVPAELPSVTSNEMGEQEEDDDVLLDVDMCENPPQSPSPLPSIKFSAPESSAHSQFVHNSPSSSRNPPEIFLRSYTSSNHNANYGESQEEWVHTREFVDLTCADRIDDALGDTAKIAATPIACLAINLLSCGNLIYPTKNGVKLHRVCEQIFSDERWLSEYSWNDKISMNLGKKTHRLPPARLLME